jgi:Secretion system C-terminal sorting domain
MMKKLLVLFCLVLVAATAMGQIPSLIEVTAENFEPYFQSDFNNVLNYVAQGVDTIVLATSGMIYTTQDTNYMVIKDPVVIMAADGLAEKPVLTHYNTTQSTSMEIFRLLDDVTFIGVAFKGCIDETEGLKYGLRYGDWTDPVSENEIKAKTGAKFVFEDCDFIGFHSLKDDALQGNVLYYLRPTNTADDHLRNTKVFFNNCYFEDIGDEAIRIAENEKYGGVNGVNAVDTLQVTNCTFVDIDAECIRVYGDLDTTNAEGLILAQHCTVVNSAPRFIYGKNYKKAIVKDILIANGRAPGILRPDRGDYNIQVQLAGSRVSHIDTFNVVFPLYYATRIGATKGGYVDESTIYGHDPQFVDYAGGDYTIQSGSPLYGMSSDGTCIGDLNWAPYIGSYVAVSDVVPAEFKLAQNYPNPFNPVTTISFDLPSDGHASLKIYNIMGRLVDTPVNGYTHAGIHEVRFNAASLPSGVYFYELTQGNNVEMKKMVFMK